MNMIIGMKGCWNCFGFETRGLMRWSLSSWDLDAEKPPMGGKTGGTVFQAEEQPIRCPEAGMSLASFRISKEDGVAGTGE